MICEAPNDAKDPEISLPGTSVYVCFASGKTRESSRIPEVVPAKPASPRGSPKLFRQNPRVLADPRRRSLLI